MTIFFSSKIQDDLLLVVDFFHIIIHWKSRHIIVESNTILFKKNGNGFNHCLVLSFVYQLMKWTVFPELLMTSSDSRISLVDWFFEEARGTIWSEWKIPNKKIWNFSTQIKSISPFTFGSVLTCRRVFSYVHNLLIVENMLSAGADVPGSVRAYSKISES